MNPSLPQDSLMMGRSPKISAAHLQRKAIVYVRQSSLQQVAKNQESTRLQYALTERALQLGWSKDQIEVIDDLGRSGASAEGRPGFQRLVAEVSLDQVGLILGIEMSRLARSCRDWHQLLEVCALFSTLIADPEGIYDPANHNDRLLLGLKGTISEAELHVLRRRMHEGRQAKAMRGELGKRVPMGYLRHPSGEVIKDPDERVQSMVMLIFEQFAVRKTVHGVLRYLVSHDLQLPMRMASGPRKGELHNVRPNRPTLANLLKNPIYAGAYVYGRRPTEARRKKPGRRVPEGPSLPSDSGPSSSLTSFLPTSPGTSFWRSRPNFRKTRPNTAATRATAPPCCVAC
jgi:DNA invertase Pin-like site-specific DNA recombinase